MIGRGGSPPNPLFNQYGYVKGALSSINKEGGIFSLFDSGEYLNGILSRFNIYSVDAGYNIPSPETCSWCQTARFYIYYISFLLIFEL